MREVLMFPTDCSRRIGISLISTFNKFSGVSLCVLKSRSAYAGVLQRKYFADALLTLRYALFLHFIPVIGSSISFFNSPIAWSLTNEIVVNSSWSWCQNFRSRSSSLYTGRSRSLKMCLSSSLNCKCTVGVYTTVKPPVSSEISDLCEISDLLLFLSYFASQNKEIKSGN